MHCVSPPAAQEPACHSLQHDDAITNVSHSFIRKIIAQTANGCQLGATLFTLTGSTWPYEESSTGGIAPVKVTWCIHKDILSSNPAHGLHADCELARDLHNRGCEIADHTVTHQDRMQWIR